MNPQTSIGRKVGMLGTAAALTAAMIIPTAVAAQDENAMVRVLHGAGDAPAVDIYADGGLIGEGLAYYEDENKDLYFGDIENSARHGFGMLLMHTEDAYVGEFVEGSPHGPGIFEGADGRTYLGMFANGDPNGMGTVIDGEGTSYQGRFIDARVPHANQVMASAVRLTGRRTDLDPVDPVDREGHIV